MDVSFRILVDCSAMGERAARSPHLGVEIAEFVDQLRKVDRHGSPENVEIDVEVVVDESVPGSGCG